MFFSTIQRKSTSPPTTSKLHITCRGYFTGGCFNRWSDMCAVFAALELPPKTLAKRFNSPIRRWRLQTLQLDGHSAAWTKVQLLRPFTDDQFIRRSNVCAGGLAINAPPQSPGKRWNNPIRWRRLQTLQLGGHSAADISVQLLWSFTDDHSNRRSNVCKCNQQSTNETDGDSKVRYIYIDTSDWIFATLICITIN